VKISEALVQNKELYDDVLHRQSFPVNIRLFNDNRAYRLIVKNIIAHMESLFSAEFSDYNPLLGISGANVGIPFNIVIIKRPTGNLIMVNPEIKLTSKETQEVTSNCGSLCLEKSIKKVRPKEVTVHHYKLQKGHLIKACATFEGKLASTVIHEIEHNQGILITDR
jgi:peptide deformylase